MTRAWPLLALVIACSFEPLDYTGKTCDSGGCAVGYACLSGRCAAEGGGSGGSGGAGTRQVVTARVMSDSDDANWTGATPNREKLFTNTAERTVIVGGGDSCAFRFTLALPQGARIEDVRLELNRIGGTATESQTYRVLMWSSPAVPAFDATHIHIAALHDSAGFAPGSGTLVSRYKGASSSNLAALLQPLVDRADWGSSPRTVGVVLEGMTATSPWSAWEDVSAGDGEAALLVVTATF